MANLTTQFTRLILSASELKEMTKESGAQWSDALVEDYLNILQDLVTVANAVDGDTLDLEALTLRVDQLEADVADLKNRVNLLELGQIALNGRVTDNEADISLIELDIVNINGVNADQDNRINDNEQHATIIWGI